MVIARPAVLESRTSHPRHLELDSDAGDWIATGGISLNWEGYPPLGPRGSKVSLAFRDPDGRAVPVRIGHGDFSERHAFVLIDWPALRRGQRPTASTPFCWLRTGERR